MVAELLNASASGIAAMAADKLVNERAAVRSEHRADAVRTWRECVSSRLPFLAAAVSTACPRVFVEQARWAHTAYASRGGEPAALAFSASLECMRDVICEQLPPEAARLAATYVDHAIDSIRVSPPNPAPPVDASTRIGRLISRYLAAVLEGDRRAAASLILDAARGDDGSAALPVRSLLLDVLVPAQIELGRMWHLNEATVAEEHFATATTQLVVSQLFAMLRFSSRNGLVAVAASVEGNAHDVGVRVLADLLEAEGWRVVYLGASVPAEDLAQAVDMFEADLLCVSAGLGSQLPAVARTIAAVRTAGRGRLVKIMVGGGGFVGTCESESDPLWRRFGADGFAATIDEGLRVAGQLCSAERKTGRD